MKKLIATIMLLVLLSTVVFAANGQQTQNQEQEQEQVQEQEQEKEHIRVEENQRNEIPSEIRGLENAVLRVRNEEQVRHLEQVMEKVRAKRQAQFEKLAELKGIAFDEVYQGEFQASGTGKAKAFGLFNVAYRYKYDVNEETGELTRVRKWYDFVYTLEDPVTEAAPETAV